MEKNPIIEKLVYALRDPRTERREFRESLEKVGEYLGIDIAKDLKTTQETVETCLKRVASHQTLTESPVLVTILRAGLPLYNGLQRAFPDSKAGFIGAARDEETLQSTISYVALPPLEDRVVVLADTMIATAGSIVDTVQLLEEYSPRQIIVAGVFASKEGIERIQEYDPTIRVYAAVIDPDLNEKGFILPGCGDAGDRSYGEKL